MQVVKEELYMHDIYIYIIYDIKCIYMYVYIQIDRQMGFPGGSADKESTYNAGDQGSIPALGRSPGEGKGYPLQYSGMDAPSDVPGTCTVPGLVGSQDIL